MEKPSEAHAYISKSTILKNDKKWQWFLWFNGLSGIGADHDNTHQISCHEEIRAIFQ